MNSKTIMIAALNPCPSNYDETVSTLKFADGVSKVKLPAKKNIQTMAQKRASAEGIPPLKIHLALKGKSKVCY